MFSSGGVWKHGSAQNGLPGFERTSWQYQPSSDAHDPNPPITLEDPAGADVTVEARSSSSSGSHAPGVFVAGATMGARAAWGRGEDRFADAPPIIELNVIASFDEQSLNILGAISEVEENPTYVGKNEEVPGGNSAQYRNIIKFPMTAVAATATPFQAQLVLNVVDFNDPASQVSVSIGPYDSNGQSDPVADSASQVWTRSDFGGGAYSSFPTEFRSLGLKSLTLGGSALSHITACIAAQIPFTLVVKLDDEAPTSFGQANSGWDSFENATNKPALRLLLATGASTTASAAAAAARGAGAPASLLSGMFALAESSRARGGTQAAAISTPTAITVDTRGSWARGGAAEAPLVAGMAGVARAPWSSGGTAAAPLIAAGVFVVRVAEAKGATAAAPLVAGMVGAAQAPWGRGEAPVSTFLSAGTDAAASAARGGGGGAPAPLVAAALALSGAAVARGSSSAPSLVSGALAISSAAAGRGESAPSAPAIGVQPAAESGLSRGGASAALAAAGAALVSAAALGRGFEPVSALVAGAAVLAFPGAALGQGQAAQIAAGASLAALAAIARGGLQSSGTASGAAPETISARGSGAAASAGELHSALILVRGVSGQGVAQVSVLFVGDLSSQIQLLLGRLTLAPVLEGAMLVGDQLRGEVDLTDLLQGLIGLDEK